MGKKERRFGLRGRLALAFLLLAVLLLRFDTLNLTPVRLLAAPYLFSVQQWEAAHLHQKWLYLLREALPGGSPSPQDHLALLEDYLLVSRQVQKEKDRLQGNPLRRGVGLGATAATRETTAPSDEHLRELIKAQGKLRARAEETLESELSAVLESQGLASRWGLLFPPVDIRFEQPPTILVVSPRDRLLLSEAILLRPEVPLLERDRLEREVLEQYNLSAYVDDLGGLATYPSIIPDTYPLRMILQFASHEWLHQYLFFRPLGRYMRSSYEMYTLNETAADLAGRELGDMAFARLGGDLTASSSLFLPEEERDPFLTQEMRKTRQQVEDLLAQGQVQDAEQYMKERWWFFLLRGYPLRKLNQAYFAFRGSYAETPASVSPIGGQLRELRQLLPSVGDFIRAISGIASYQQFLDLLEQLRAQKAS
ncbi:MAG: hypothetical protein HYU29_06450 [Chloroflexi bacterium]|nr:hypothetical protein [Chloroflexota bacterium]